MLALGTLCFLGIKSSHALFESKQGLVDLCTLGLSLFVVALAVLGSLTSSQINKKQLSTLSHSFLLDFDLSDSVRPTGSVISLRGMSGPDRVSLLDQLKDLVIIVYELFSKARDLYNSVLVLLQLELRVIVKKVIELASIDFVHGNGNSEVPLVRFPVVYPSFEQVFNSYVLDPIHCVGLSGSCLPIGKNGDDSLVEYQVQDRAHLEEVKFFIGLLLTKCVVKLKLRIIDCFGYTIHFVSAVVHDHLWVDY